MEVVKNPNEEEVPLSKSVEDGAKEEIAVPAENEDKNQSISEDGYKILFGEVVPIVKEEPTENMEDKKEGIEEKKEQIEEKTPEGNFYFKELNRNKIDTALTSQGLQITNYFKYYLEKGNIDKVERSKMIAWSPDTSKIVVFDPSDSDLISILPSNYSAFKVRLSTGKTEELLSDFSIFNMEEIRYSNDYNKVALLDYSKTYLVVSDIKELNINKGIQLYFKEQSEAKGFNTSNSHFLALGTSGVLDIYSLETKQYTCSVKEFSEVSDIKYNKNRNRFYIAQGNRIRIASYEDGEKKIEDIKDESTNKIVRLICNKKGNKIVTLDQEMKFKLWDMDTKSVEKEIPVGKETIKDMCFSFDDAYFIVYNDNEPVFLYVIKLEDMEFQREILPPDSNYLTVCVSPFSNKLVLSMYTQSALMKAYDFENKKMIWDQKSLTSYYFFSYTSTDNLYFFINTQIIEFDCNSFEVKRTFDMDDYPSTFELFNTNSSLCLLSLNNSELRKMDLTNWKCLASTKFPFDIIEKIKLDPKDQYAYTFSSGYTLFKMKVEDLSIVFKVSFEVRHSTICFNFDNSKIFLQGDSSSISIFSLKQNNELEKLPGVQTETFDYFKWMAILPFPHKKMVTADNSGNLILWHSESLAKEASVPEIYSQIIMLNEKRKTIMIQFDDSVLKEYSMENLRLRGSYKLVTTGNLLLTKNFNFILTATQNSIIKYALNTDNDFRQTSIMTSSNKNLIIYLKKRNRIVIFITYQGLVMIDLATLSVISNQNMPELTSEEFKVSDDENYLLFITDNSTGLTIVKVEDNSCSKFINFKERETFYISAWWSNEEGKLEAILRDLSSYEYYYHVIEMKTGKSLSKLKFFDSSKQYLNIDTKFGNVLFWVSENQNESWFTIVSLTNINTLKETILFKEANLSISIQKLSKDGRFFAYKYFDWAHVVVVWDLIENKEHCRFLHDEKQKPAQVQAQAQQEVGTGGETNVDKPAIESNAQENPEKDPENPKPLEENKDAEEQKSPEIDQKPVEIPQEEAGGGAPNENLYYNYEETIYSFGMSSDGNLLVDGDQEHKILIYDLITKQKAQELLFLKRKLASAEFTSEDKHLLTIYYDGFTVLWDWSKGEILKTIYGTSQYISRILISNENEVLTLRSGDSISLWKPFEGFFRYEGEIFQPKADNLNYIDIMFSYDWKYFIINQNSNLFCIYDYNSKASINEIKTDADLYVSAWDLSREKHQIIIAYDKYFEICDYEKNTKTFKWDLPDKYHCREALFVPKTNSILYTSYQDAENPFSFSLLNLDSKKIERVSMITQTPIDTYAYTFISLNGQMFIFYSNSSSSITVWSIKALRRLYEIKLSKEESVNKLFFTNDSKCFIAATSTTTIRVWQLENGLEINKFNETTDKSFGAQLICLSPDDKYLIASKTIDFKCWNLISFNTYIHLREFFMALDAMEVPEELTTKFSTSEFNSLMTKETLYPYYTNILSFLVRRQDLSNLRKLFKVCQIFNTYPQLIQDYEDKSPLDIAIEKKNLSTIELLLNFYFKNPQGLHCCPMISAETLTSLFDLAIENGPQVLESRFLLIPGEKPLVPVDIGDIFVSSFDSGFLGKEEYLKVYGLTASTLENADLRLTTPEFRILDLPGVLTPKSPFLEEVSELEIQNPIFQSPVLQAILLYKWKKYAKWEFVRDAVFQLVFLLIYTANSIYVSPCRLNDEQPPKYNWSEWENCSKSNFILNIVLFAFILYIVLSEIWELKYIGWRRYKRSIWNFIDFFIITFGATTLIVSMTELNLGLENLALLKSLNGISTFFVWARMLDYSRGFEGTAFLIRILIQTVSDMKYFITIMFILLTAFAFTAFSLQREYSIGKWNSFQAFYRVLLGDFGDFSNMESDMGILLWVVFLLMTLLMMIIMLNLLIAIISDTYDKVVGMETLANAYEKTNIIVDMEKTMSKVKINLIDSQIKDYLVVAYTRPMLKEDDSSAFNDRMRSKIEKIEKKVLSLEEELTKGFERINRKDKYMLEYLEKNFIKLFEKVEETKKKN